MPVMLVQARLRQLRVSYFKVVTYQLNFFFSFVDGNLLNPNLANVRDAVNLATASVNSALADPSAARDDFFQLGLFKA